MIGATFFTPNKGYAWARVVGEAKDDSNAPAHFDNCQNVLIETSPQKVFLCRGYNIH